MLTLHYTHHDRYYTNITTYFYAVFTWAPLISMVMIPLQTNKISKLYIWLECPEGTLVVWGNVVIFKNKLLIKIKRFLFTASKNIKHSPSYEQSKNHTSITNLSQHVHVRVTMYPLTTILLITIHIIHYTHHRYYAYNEHNACARGVKMITISPA